MRSLPAASPEFVLPRDVISLTLQGLKKWPVRGTLVDFALFHCELTRQDAALGRVKNSILDARASL